MREVRKAFACWRPSASASSADAFALGAPIAHVALVASGDSLPPPFFAFLAVATLTYLGLVEILKRLLFRRALD